MEATECIAPSTGEDNPEAKPHSLGLDNTKKANSAKIVRQRVKDFYEVVGSSFDDVAASMLDQCAEEGQPLEGNPLEMHTDLTAKKIAAQKRFTQLVSAVDKIIDGIRKSVTSRALKAVCVDLIEASKYVKTWTQVLVSGKRFLSKAEQTTKRKANHADAARAQMSTAPANPVWSSVITLCKEQPYNTSRSMYDAKGGHRIGLIDFLSGKDVLSEIKNNALIKRMLKDLATHMRSTGCTSAANPIRDVTKVRRIEKFMRAGIDSMLLTRLVLPEQPWADKVPELFGTSDQFLLIPTTNNGCIEARAMLSGSESLVGFPYASVDGASFTEKRRTPSHMTVDALRQLCHQTGGFHVEMTEEHAGVYVITSGHITIIASTGARYMRWGVSSDENDNARVERMCVEIIKSFPECANPSHAVGIFRLSCRASRG